jgi:hypothetical protein
MLVDPAAPIFVMEGAEGKDCTVTFPALGIAIPSPAMKSAAPVVVIALAPLVVTMIVLGEFSNARIP